MASISITRGGDLPDSATKADFHALVDNATVSLTNILNADIDAAANIADTKLSTIYTAGKVNITALTVSAGAAGMLLVFSGTGFYPLSIGSAGQTLTVSGTARLIWA